MNANLSNAQLSGAKIDRAHLNGANLDFAVISRRESMYEEFVHRNVEHAIAAYILDESHLFQATFNGCSLTNVDLSDCKNLTYAQLSEAKNVDPDFLAKLKAEEEAAAVEADNASKNTSD